MVRLPCYMVYYIKLGMLPISISVDMGPTDTESRRFMNMRRFQAIFKDGILIRDYRIFALISNV
ncbi:hypothetical protein GCM10009000_060770 [Halobacterium noricense]|uniref:Transposase n=1 Tax=Haladaptatus pallidirubidus TaxID=1008152 RepID=A0AAV3UJ12_9EURY